MADSLSRRELLRLLAGGTSAAVLDGVTGCGNSVPASASTSPFARQTDFTGAADAEGWGPGWACSGVANLRRAAGAGVLEAGSDVFPNDPRPLAFAVDGRFDDGRIEATIVEAGREVGVALRRSAPDRYYAALVDTDTLRLAIVRRLGTALDTLASVPLPPTALPGDVGAARLQLAASGRSPTQLRAQLLGPDGLAVAVEASDATAELQVPGEAGVLSRADTLLPYDNPVLPSLGNLHLLPYGVQEGEVVIGTPVGAQFLELIRRRSTARFAAIAIEPAQAPAATPPSIVAAFTGAPLPGGARLHIATDLPAEIDIEIAASLEFSGATRIAAGGTDAYDARVHPLTGQPPGPRYWRARARRGGVESVGPVRTWRVLPSAAEAAPLSLVYGACASQFNAIFDHIAQRAPDLFLWQGDLNYPDTQGPFAQTLAGYAGIWRHFLANPRLAPILERAHFVAGRDDHDYGRQDANAQTLVPWGLAPWSALVNPLDYQCLSLGLADVWLLDQRRHKSDPTLADTVDKTLLGTAQREWLLQGLAASRAPFQVICSPCTLAPAPGANARDGSWAAGYTAERDLLLAHLREHATVPVIFLSGDTHFTLLWEADGLFEQRACPLDIPLPNDQSISNPNLELSLAGAPGVSYWSRRGHFSALNLAREGALAVLTLELVREDGVTVASRRFESTLTGG